jgi:hypothetical protein
MKTIRIVILISSLSALTFWGCSEDNPTQPDPVILPASTLSDIQDKVFNVYCTSSGCHGQTNTQSFLLLTEGSSHSSMVDVPSILYPAFKRVEPFNSSNSLLIKILRGDVTPRMPYERDPLPSAMIDSIAKWINKGALNN